MDFVFNVEVNELTMIYPKKKKSELTIIKVKVKQNLKFAINIS